MGLTPATNRQIPDHSMFDYFNKQTYLGNSYVISNLVNLSGTSETGILLIENPAVTTTAFPVQKSIFVTLRRYTSDLEEVLINNYFNPTIASVSTKTTPVNLRPASPNTSIAKCYTNGQFSTSGNGTVFGQIGCASSFYLVQENTLVFILDPGQTALFTATALTANTNLYSVISWYEI